jgi:hypothetical protein
VHELNRLVALRSPRESVMETLGLAEEPPGQGLTPTTFARHCPICAAELIVRQGTPADSILNCPTCSTNLVVRWDGDRMWLDVRRP